MYFRVLALLPYLLFFHSSTYGSGLRSSRTQVGGFSDSPSIDNSTRRHSASCGSTFLQKCEIQISGFDVCRAGGGFSRAANEELRNSSFQSTLERTSGCSLASRFTFYRPPLEEKRARSPLFPFRRVGTIPSTRPREVR